MSIQSNRDWEMRVREIAYGASGLRPPVIDIKGKGLVPPTIPNDSIPVTDRTRA